MNYERDVNIQWYRFLLTCLINSSQYFVALKKDLYAPLDQ